MVETEYSLLYLLIYLCATTKIKMVNAKFIYDIFTKNILWIIRRILERATEW